MYLKIILLREVSNICRVYNSLKLVPGIKLSVPLICKNVSLGMVDADGQPIARENYGLNGKPERTLLGRKVLCNDYMPNISETVESDTVVAFLYDWGNYMYNTNYAMTVKSYEDNDTEDQVTKAVEICDGKSIDNNGLVTLTKKAA